VSECPIGLICELLSKRSSCENRSYCHELAEPWPLPYWLNPFWAEGVNCLEVNLPDYEWDCPNVEHLITQQDSYNAWVARLQVEYWVGGWWQSISLPYEAIPEGGIIVTNHLKLGEEVTFSRPWKYDKQHKYDLSPTHWESFMPALPIGARYTNTHLFTEIEEDGFYPECWLLYKRDFDEEWDED
jgi:hypothetical protein